MKHPVRAAMWGALLAGLGAAQVASAADTSVDLGSYFDQTIVPAAGGNYPVLGTISIGGVSFMTGATTLGGQGALAVIGGAGPDTVTIATDVVAPAAVYTVINSGWGVDNVQTGEVDLEFSNGSSYTYALVEGVNIRDHYAGQFINGTESPDVIGSYEVTGSERLDAQRILIPTAFAGDTLTGVKFVNYGDGDPQGSPFLAALTISTVPEPSALGMTWLGLAAVGIGAALARRRRA